MNAWSARRTWPLWGAFAVACAAIWGSLYFSEIRHFAPCNLCWYQRIFMYPLAPILAFALAFRVPTAAYLVLSLALVGQGISVYHYLVQKTSLFASAAVCGTGPPCSGIYVDWFGVVTIPLLAMTGFMLITVSMAAFLAAAPPTGRAAEPAALHGGSLAAALAIAAVGLAAWFIARAVHVEAPAWPQAEAPRPGLNGAAGPRDGGSLFAAHCAACHGPQGQGIPTLTPSLQTSSRVREMAPDALAALIRQGVAQDDPRNQTGNVMPPNGGANLSEPQLQAVVAYLKQAWRE